MDEFAVFLGAGRRYAAWPAIHRLLTSSAVQSAGLCTIILITYYHDLYGVARADQLIYFYRTSGINDFWSLTFGAFDFNRTHAAGDYNLFRPLLYFFLGIEKWLWGYNFIAWQATSLGLHAVIVLSLFTYFRTCLRDAGSLPQTSLLPFATAVFFATLYAGSEMVAWQHLAGYLLFCLLLVQSGIRYQAFVARPSARRGVALVVLATMAAFTYELGVVALGGFAGLCILTAMRNNASRRLISWTAVGLLLGILLYLAADYIDSRTEASKLPRAPLCLVIQDTEAYASRWIGEIFIPALAAPLHPGSRITADFNPTGAHRYTADIVILATLVFGCLAAQMTKRRLDDIQRGILFLSLGIVYTATYVLDRAIPRGLEITFMTNTYYAYTFALLFLLAVFHIVFVPSETRTGTGATVMKSLIIVGLLQIAAIGAYNTHDIMVRERYEYAAPIGKLVSKINELIYQHRSERDFSFTVAPHCKGNPDLPWFSEHATIKRTSYPTAWVLYPQYERDTGGKYTVSCGD